MSLWTYCRGGGLKMRSEHRGVFEGQVRIREESRNAVLSQGMMNVLNFIFQIVISQASAWAFVHIFTTAFELEISEIPFFFLTLAISIIMLLLVRGAKAGIVLLIIFMIIGAAVLFIHRDKVIAECAGLYVRVIRAFTSYYGYVSEVDLDIETSYNVTNVMVCFAFLPIWQVSYSYGKHTYPSLLTIFLLLPLFLCVLGGQNPSLLSVTVMALCILALYFTCMTESINTDHEMTDRVRKRIRFILIILAVILTSAFMTAAAFVIYPRISNAFNDASAVYTSHFFRDLLADIPGNPFDISKTGLSEGELQRAGSVVQTGETAFSLSYEKDNPRVTYFRSFTGDAYTGSRWAAAETELPSSLFPANVTYPSIYHPNVNTNHDGYRNPLLYYPASYLSSIYRTADRENTLTITDRSGGGNYFYMPYCVRGKITSGQSTASFKVYSDLYAIGSASEVSYPVYTPGSLVDVLALVKMEEFYKGLSQPDGEPVICYMDAEQLSKLLDDYGTHMTAEEILESSYSEFVVKTEDGMKLHYRPKENCLSAYESYVFRNSVQVQETERLREAAAQLAEQYSIDVSGLEYVKAILAVQNYLSAQCRFNENPGAIGSDKDFAETFLFEKREGYCVHFATAGTLLLRMLGIPARYVEGFLIPPCMAGETIRVTDYNAHAWTEVFIPGYGWYPVEMTPSEVSDEPESTSESEAEPESVPQTSSDENASDEATKTETETTEQAKPSEVIDDNDDPTDRTKPKEGNSRTVLIVLLVLLILAGIIFLLYWSRRIKPKSKLRGSTGRQTYLNIYNEIRKQAFRRRKFFVVDDSADKLAELYPDIDPEVLRSVQKYAKEAYYSTNDISEEEIQDLYSLYADRSFEAKDSRSSSEQHEQEQSEDSKKE